MNSSYSLRIDASFFMIFVAAVLPMLNISASYRHLCFLFLFASRSFIFPSSIKAFLVKEPASWCFHIAMVVSQSNAFQGIKNSFQSKKKKTKSNDITVPWVIKTCQFQILKHSIQGGFYFEQLNLSL